MMYLNSVAHCLLNSITLPLNAAFFFLSHIMSLSGEERRLAGETTEPFRTSSGHIR